MGEGFAVGPRHDSSDAAVRFVFASKDVLRLGVLVDKQRLARLIITESRW